MAEKKISTDLALAALALLESGENYTQEEVSELFNVSRTTLRRALMGLANNADNGNSNIQNRVKIVREKISARPSRKARNPGVSRDDFKKIFIIKKRHQI